MNTNKTTDIGSEKIRKRKRNFLRFLAGTAVSLIPSTWPIVYISQIKAPNETPIIEYSKLVKNLAFELDRLNRKRPPNENDPRLKNAMSSLDEYVSEITSRRDVVEYNQVLESYRSIGQGVAIAMVGGVLTTVVGMGLSLNYALRKEEKELDDLLKPAFKK